MRVPYTRSVFRLFSPERRMREDWDLRARRDARYYIDCGHAGTEESFWGSGPQDLEGYVLRGIALDPSAEALEIGCGMGRLLRPLSERVARVTGVDISGEMIRRGQEALRDRDNVRWLRTDGDLPDTPDACLDLVYSHIVFQHIPAKAAVARYFAEAARVLAGGGVFRFQVDGRPPRRLLGADTWHGVRYGAAEVRGELASLGFDVVDLAGEGTQFLWVTARRRSEPGRRDTGAVRVLSREWDAAALDRLCERLGVVDRGRREAVLAGAVPLRELADGLLERHRSAPPRDYVAAVYRALLAREPDADGLAHYAGEIERGIHRTNVLDCLLASAEFDAKHRSTTADATPPSGRP